MKEFNQHLDWMIGRTQKILLALPQGTCIQSKQLNKALAVA